MSTFEVLPFYRGVSQKYPSDRPSLLTPRHDRRPKNSSIAFHEIADRWFERRFGVRYRSQGVFITSGLLSATTYAASPAHVMRVVPLSDYRFCWSPRVSDLLFGANKFDKSSTDEIEVYLDSADYRDHGLQEAHDAGHEVMLHCERYIAIPVPLLGITVPSELPSIILPS